MRKPLLLADRSPWCQIVGIDVLDECMRPESLVHTARSAIRTFFATAALDEVIPPSELEEGLAQFDAELTRLALDIRVAEARSLSLAEASLDFEAFPHMSRIHAFVGDLLTMSLPAELEAWARRAIAEPEPAGLDELRAALVEASRSSQNELVRCLARFVLFETIRLGLLIAAYTNPTEVLGVGIDDGHLSCIAEVRVDEWLRYPSAPFDVRPIDVILCAALDGLAARATEMRSALRTLRTEAIEELSRRAKLEEALSEMDAVDSLLLRNAVAPAIGEQRLTVELLVSRHPYVFRDMPRNSLDQRLRRLQKRSRPKRRRKRTALIDIVTATHGSDGGRS